MKLYSFFNSSASYRVRIALNLKGVTYETVGVNLRSGAQFEDDYVGPISPAPLVPALEANGLKIGQSTAILDWLDREFKDPQLTPEEPVLRSKVLSLINMIACDIHPLNNLRVLKYLSGPLDVTPEAKQQWYQHWIDQGFVAIEHVLSTENGPFCFGDQPNLADCYLIPQIANALRMKCDMSPYTKSMAIYEYALEQKAFADAAPNAQPDYTD